LSAAHSGAGAGNLKEDSVRRSISLAASVGSVFQTFYNIDIGLVFATPQIALQHIAERRTNVC